MCNYISLKINDSNEFVRLTHWDINDNFEIIIENVWQIDIRSDSDFSFGVGCWIEIINLNVDLQAGETTGIIVVEKDLIIIFTLADQEIPEL